jgi:hypothetical protein
MLALEILHIDSLSLERKESAHVVGALVLYRSEDAFITVVYYLPYRSSHFVSILTRI